MNHRLIILIIIGIVNLIVAIVCYLIKLRRKDNSAITSFIVMVICPVLGPLFYLLAYFFRVMFFRDPVDLEGVVFSKDKYRGVFRSQEERESNLISIEEAIEITNNKDLRRLMMNVVQGDIKNSLQSIILALNSEDTETAHYAASVLQDAFNEFRMKVEGYRKQLREIRPEEDENQSDGDNVVGFGAQNANNSAEDLEFATEAILYMNGFLEQKVFPDVEQKSFVYIMETFGQTVYEADPYMLDGSMYEAICMRLLDIRDYDKCELWCTRGKEQYPGLLSSFTCQLKLYFNRQDREKFFEVVDEIKHSPVVLDRETLELIKVFC